MAMFPLHIIVASFHLLCSTAQQQPAQCTAMLSHPQWTTFHGFNTHVVPKGPGSEVLMDHLNDANAIFAYGGLYHAMTQKGGSNWAHVVSNDLARWWRLPDSLDGEANSTWDGATCDGTVSFPDLGNAPYNGTTPVMMYGPDCGMKLPPVPPNGHLRVGDYPRVAVALPAAGGEDPYLVNWTRPAGDPVSFDGVPCSFPGRVWRSTRGEYWNMLCAWDGRGPWARYTTSDRTLLTGWKLADKQFATDDSGATPAGGGAGALFHKVPNATDDDLYMINLDTGSTFAVGKYDSSLESMHLRSNATTGAAIREVLDYSRGVYKWATTGLADDGRLLTIAWLDEGECADDSPRVAGVPASCSGMRHRSVLSLPREILWDQAAKQLISRPVAEITSLRNATFISGSSSSSKFTINPGERQLLTDIPEAAGGALDLSVSFALDIASSRDEDNGNTPRRTGDGGTTELGIQNFGLAVRASRWSLDGAAVELVFNVSAPAADGSRRVGVTDVATAKHLPPVPVQLTRWMNDTDLFAGDYALTHHPPSSGDTAKTCQALCDADAKCAAWVWAVRGVPTGAADCVLKKSTFGCPGAASTRAHPCAPCALTAGVKVPGACTAQQPKTPATSFEVTVQKGEGVLDVRVLVDRPVVEVFVQGGRGAFVAASNFSASLASVHLLNRGSAAVNATVSAFGMGCGWSAALPVPNTK